MPAVGFIGLGSMGGAIAARLTSGYHLRVYDPAPAAVQHLVAHGACAAEPDELAGASEIVFTCLPGPDQVREVVLGPGGLAEHMRPGSVLVDMSTSTPLCDGDLAARLGPAGIRFADAPVSGGPQGARAGTLAIMVGAALDAYEVIEPVLRSVSSNVYRVGDPGSGHAIKLVVNLMSACNRVTALEAVRLSVLCGLELGTAIEVINKSGGRSYISESTFPKYLMAGGYQPQGFTLDLLLKDVRLALELAGAHGTPLGMGQVAEGLLAAALDRFGAADVNQMMAEWFE
jgi:3-hydroxyisobutyrate dehydrogenase